MLVDLVGYIHFSLELEVHDLQTFRASGIHGFKTHLVVAEYRSDIVQILQRFCRVDLCQPFGCWDDSGM